MNERARALLRNPADVSDRDLIMGATGLLAERTTVGHRVVNRWMRELHRRGLSYREIADLTGFSVGVVFSRLRTETGIDPTRDQRGPRQQ